MKRIVIPSLVLAAVAAALPLAGQVLPRLGSRDSSGAPSPAAGDPAPGAIERDAAAGKAVGAPLAPGSVPAAATPTAQSASKAASPSAKEALPRPAALPPSAPAAPSARPEGSAGPTASPKQGNASSGTSPAGRPGAPASASSGSGGSARRELVIENALVMLIDDNKVPATETGMLTAVHVKEGALVEKGALLAEIDSRATLAKQRVAQGELAAALAQAENDAEVEVARYAIEVTKADLDANTEIRRTNKAAVSEAEHRKFVFQYQRAIAQEKQAINEKEIARLTATAKQAQLDATTVELELRQIRAPFEGQVVEIMKHPGDWVTSGEPIMHVVGLKRVRVKGFVSANLASHDEVLGKPVTITVYAGGQREYTTQGTIGFASPVIEGLSTSRQFRIWAEVDNVQSVDPITGQAYWRIQPGSVAKMVIDLTPAPRGGVATSGSASPSRTPESTKAGGTSEKPKAAGTPTSPGARDGEGSGRVRSFKPVLDGPALTPSENATATRPTGEQSHQTLEAASAPAAAKAAPATDHGPAAPPGGAAAEAEKKPPSPQTSRER